MNRHILVYWVAEDIYSISSEKFVLDKKCLQDSTHVGLVQHGDPTKRKPKGGWQSFEAKVLGVSEDLDDILRKERELCDEKAKQRIDAEGDEQVDETSRTERRDRLVGTQPKVVVKRRMAVQDEQSDVNAKKRAMTEHSNASILREAEAVQKYTALLIRKDEEIKKLKTENEQLKSDREELKVLRKLNIELQNALLKTNEKKRSMDAPEQAKTPMRSVAIPGVMSPLATSIVPSSSTQTGNAGVTSDVNGASSNADTDTIHSFIPRERVASAVKLIDWRKTACNLLTAAFTPEELQSCSVTGRVTKATKTSRPPLDAAKVTAIVDCIRRHHPEVDKRNIIDRFAQKLKDDRARLAKLAAKSDLESVI